MMYSYNLKALRERLGVTQKTLAELINVQRPVYTQYENEYTTMPCIHLNTVCNYFKVSFDFIFNFTDVKTYSNFSVDIDKIKAGQRLKGFRKENKLTQEKLAKILNTTRSVIADYERSRYLIATPFLYDICRKYHISADYLLGKIDNPKYLK